MKLLINLIQIIFLSLLQHSKSLSKIKFTIEKIGNADNSCISDEGRYIFDLHGTFDQEFNTKDKIIVKLEYPDTEIECTPLSKSYYSEDSLKCEIDICQYPLDENVLLSPEGPKSDKFEFPNWSYFMNEIPGISNRLDSSYPYCYPSYKTTFIAEDIKSEGCDGNKNKFIVSGYWNNIEAVSKNEMQFNMPLNDQNGKKAICNFRKIEEVVCLFEGFGKIQFDDFYFKSVLSPYKFSSLGKSINVEECLSGGKNIYKISFILLKVVAFVLFLFL
jgi:hypothetical protein